MAGHASKTIDKTTLWSGKMSPLSMSYGKMMMWFFLVSDALTFTGLLVAYGFARHKFTGTWPGGEEVFHSMPGMDGNYPLMYVALMTFLLIISSVTMVLAVEAGHRMDKKAVIKWMVWTVIGGLFFLGSQAWEWGHFIHGSHDGKMLSDGTLFHGANLMMNEYGPMQYADFFFFITGFHGFHVFSGVLINFIVLIGVIRG
ncbi:MAG: cytochrome c oxidase subunit 3, partial [Sphingobacteriales bacterium]